MHAPAQFKGKTLGREQMMKRFSTFKKKIFPPSVTIRDYDNALVNLYVKEYGGYLHKVLRQREGPLKHIYDAMEREVRIQCGCFAFSSRVVL